MNSCKDMFPKGDMRYLNHKNERNQLFNVYNIPRTCTSTESKIHALFSSILQKTHMRLGAFKELACGYNTYPLREDSNAHRLQTTPELPGQLGTSK